MSVWDFVGKRMVLPHFSVSGLNGKLAFFCFCFFVRAHVCVCVTVHCSGTCIYRALGIISSSLLLLSPCNALLKTYLQYSRHDQGKVEKKRETLIIDICKTDFTLTYMFQFKEEDNGRSNNSKNVEEKRKLKELLLIQKKE